jgi:ribosomal protein S18 acetylase RimI-like enzyme
VPEAREALALAFRDNPLNVAVIGADPERRLRSNRAGMRLLLPVARQLGWVRVVGAPRVEGALIALPPLAYPLPPPSLPPQLRALCVQGFRVRARWSRVFEHLNALHPVAPHWYLATLGVVPEARGRGQGRALLETLLARADADAQPCYLETDRAENVPFYEGGGFGVERESEILGVRVWHMQRPARG